MLAEPQWVDNGDCKTLFQKIRGGVPTDGIVVTDTGLHQLLVRSHFDVRSPRGLIFPSDFQSMGFGIPAAIGAALGAKDRKIIAIVGDGGFLMVGPELIAAKREKLGLPVLVFCDNSLGIIRHQQIQKFGHEESTRLDATDLVAFSSWLGIEYALANEHLAEQIQAAFTRTIPTVIEVRIEDSRDFSRLRKKNFIKSSLRAVIGY
jgi:acetolactate synthase-1/2/3 large subunit